jgi:hypothetical protein
MEDLSAVLARPRLRLLLDHFAKIKDARQAWKVAYPLRDVLFLVVCGTIVRPRMRGRLQRPQAGLRLGANYGRRDRPTPSRS